VVIYESALCGMNVVVWGGVSGGRGYGGDGGHLRGRGMTMDCERERKEVRVLRGSVAVAGTRQ